MSAATRRVERMNRHHRRHRTRPLWTVTTRGLVEGPPVPYGPGSPAVAVFAEPFDARTFDDLLREHGSVLSPAAGEYVCRQCWQGHPLGPCP